MNARNAFPRYVVRFYRGTRMFDCNDEGFVIVDTLTGTRSDSFPTRALAEAAALEANGLDVMYAVLKTDGRTFGIYDNKGKLVEGGFFSRGAADAACAVWNTK